ncbi:MAG: DUF2183 domain-containing protein, partial [Planctomycetota bacterium]
MRSRFSLIHFPFQIWLFLCIFFASLSCVLADEAYIIPFREVKEASNGKGMIKVAKLIRGRGPGKASPGMSKFKNFKRLARVMGLNPAYYLNPLPWFPTNWKKIGNDIRGEEVIVSWQDSRGKRVTRSVLTDGDGHVWIQASLVKGKEITISLPSYSRYKAQPKKVSLFSLADFPGDTLFFTDHDDTQKYTGVVKVSKKIRKDGDHKKKKNLGALAHFLFENPYDWKAFPGGPELARGITKNGRVPMIVLTGSPTFLAPDLNTFYDINGYPTPAAIHLKNLKDPFDPHPDPSGNLEYKGRYIENILNKPRIKQKIKTIIFDGDRGQQDPEVAYYLAKKFPHIHFIVGIHNITSESVNTLRFQKMKGLPNLSLVVYNNKYEFAKLLYKKGKISKAALEKVGEAIQKSNCQIEKDGKFKKKAFV